MPQYIQREYSSIEQRDMATVWFFVWFVSIILTCALSLVLYHWCKRIEKKDRDKERKQWQEAREFGHRFMSKQREGEIEIPKTNFKKKLEFVF